MAFNRGTEVANLALDDFRHTSVQQNGIDTLQTLYDTETFVSSATGSGGNGAVSFVDNSDSSITTGVIIGGHPKGLYDSANAPYELHDAVYTLDGTEDIAENRTWYLSTTNSNSAAPGDAGWRQIAVTYQQGRFFHQGTEGSNNGLGANQGFRFADTRDIDRIQLFNTTVATSGSFDLNIPSGQTGAAPTLVEIDQVVFHNTNASQTPYMRFSDRLTGYDSDSYIGDIILDGDTNGYGIYLQAAPLGDLAPRSITLNRGFLVGHAGGGADTGYTLIRNLDATRNANTIDLSGNTFKFDVAAANGAGSNWDDVADARLMEFRNTADGTGLGIVPRRNVDNNQRAGQALITSEFIIHIEDDNGNNVEGASISIPIVGGTDSVGTGSNVIPFSTNNSSANTAVPDGSHFLSIADAGFTGSNELTTDSNGNTPTTLAHLAYWQTEDTGDQDANNRRDANGNALFIRHGNTGTAYIARAGYVPGHSMEVDFTGPNVKTYSTELQIDTNVVGGTAATRPTEVTFDETTGTFTVTGHTTMNNVRNSIHFEHIDQTLAGVTSFTYGGIDNGFVDGNGNNITINGAFTIQANANDQFQGITNANLALGAGVSLNGGEYSSLIAFNIHDAIDVMIEAPTVEPSGVVRGSTFNAEVRLNSGSTLEAGNRFNDHTPGFFFSNVTNQTFDGGTIGYITNAPGTWTGNTFLNTPVIEIDDATILPTATQAQVDATPGLTLATRVLDATGWDNTGAIQFGGSGTYSVILEPVQADSGDYSAIGNASLASSFPDNVIEIENTFDFPLRYRVMTGAAGTAIGSHTQLGSHVGEIAVGATDRIAITRASLADGANIYRVAVVGRRLTDVFTEEYSYSAEGTAPNIQGQLAIDPLAATGDTSDNFANLTAANTATSFTISIASGTNTYESAAQSNIDFLSLKGNSNAYVNYIGHNGANAGLRGRTNGGVLFYADGTSTAGIQVTGTSASAVPIQGAAFTDGSTTTELLGNVAAFNAAVVTPLQLTLQGGGTLDIGVASVADTVIDYTRIGNQLDSSLTGRLVLAIARVANWISRGASSRIPARSTFDSDTEGTNNIQ